jgi:hypothetical protein
MTTFVTAFEKRVAGSCCVGNGFGVPPEEEDDELDEELQERRKSARRPPRMPVEERPSDIAAHALHRAGPRRKRFSTRHMGDRSDALFLALWRRRASEPKRWCRGG